MTSISTLRDEPRFVRWAIAETVSIVGTMQTTVALPILVYQATGSAASTGALTAIRVVPYLLFGLIAGPLADRGNRRLLIIGGNVVEGCLVATIPIAAALDALTMTLVYAVALLSATAFVFSDAAVFGAVPALVGRDRIAAANGLLGSLASGAEIVGPVLAGVLIATAGTTTTIAINAATFLGAAAIQSTIGGNFRAADPATDGSAAAVAPEGTRRQLGHARRFIRDQPTLRVLFVVGFANSFAFGAVLGLLVPFAVRQFDLPDAAGRIGVLYAALGVGGLVAGLVLPRFFHVDRIRLIASACLAGAGGSVAALLVSPSVWVAAIAVGGFGVAITLLIVVGITYRQSVTPDELRSTVNVVGRMISWGGQPFGAAAGAAIAELASVRAAYAVAAAVLLVDATVAAIALRPHRGPTPPGRSVVEV